MCCSAFVLSAVFFTSAAANPGKSTRVPFLGDSPGDTAIKKELVGDFRRFSEAERVAVLEITLLCELDRGALSRKREYDRWEKRCKKTEALWTTKYRTRHESRMIDIQMHLYLDRRRSMSRSATRYFAQKAVIARKVKRRQDTAKDVKDAVRYRKMVSETSTEILRFFFALRDLIAEARK